MDAMYRISWRIREMAFRKTVYEGTTIGSEGCGSIGTELEVPEGIVAFGDDNGGASSPVENGSVATTTL